MEKEQPTQLLLQIKTEDEDSDEIEELTRQLLMELRDEDVESAELVREESLPDGAKSVEAVTLGAIIMAVLPKAVPKIIELLQTWIQRDSRRRVTFKGKIGGKDIEFEGNSNDFEAFMKSMEGSGGE